MILAIVQARMGSTRLPGKVLRVAAGKTLLEHLVERLGGARRVDAIVVATSDLPGDDAIAEVCERAKISCFRGSERDVLDRYYRAAAERGADTVVRITADCPLIDPEVVDHIVGVQQHDPGLYDLVTNRYPLTYPDGLDVDVVPFAALAVAWREAKTPYQREHVIPYFWESGMRVHNVEVAGGLFFKYRWTVDYEEDAQLVEAILESLYVPGRVFGMREIIQYLDGRPELSLSNAKYIPAEH